MNDITALPQATPHLPQNERTPPKWRQIGEAVSANRGRHREEGVKRTEDGRKSRSKFDVLVYNRLATPVARYRIDEQKFRRSDMDNDSLAQWALNGLSEHALGRMRLLGKVSDRHVEAGAKLYADWRQLVAISGVGFSQSLLVTLAEVEVHVDCGRRVGQGFVEPDASDGDEFSDENIDEPFSDVADYFDLQQCSHVDRWGYSNLTPQEAPLDERASPDDALGVADPLVDIVPSRNPEYQPTTLGGARERLIAAERAVVSQCGADGWRLIEAWVLGAGVTPRNASAALLRRALDAVHDVQNPIVIGRFRSDIGTYRDEMQHINRGCNLPPVGQWPT